MNADASLAAEQEDLRAVDGRVPGRRGRETRRKLLAQTAEMLGNHRYRELAVVEIARQAEVSPATFYQYFSDVESAILVIAEHVANEGARRLTQRVDALVPGQTADLLGPAQALASEALAFWDEGRAVLSVVDLVASEGDQRFSTLRTSMLGPPTEALVETIRAQQAAGHLGADVDPKATAASLVSMLAHVANHQPGLEEWAGPGSNLADSLARIIVGALS